MKSDALTKYLQQHSDTEFIVGEDNFDDLTINASVVHKGFYYFTNSSKPLVKRFVLKRTKQSEKVCSVTLIKKENGKFEPRFEFLIDDLTKKSVENLELPVTEAETRLIKSRINLDDCHKEFAEILTFLRAAATSSFRQRNTLSLRPTRSGNSKRL